LAISANSAYFFEFAVITLTAVNDSWPFLEQMPGTARFADLGYRLLTNRAPPTSL